MKGRTLLSLLLMFAGILLGLSVGSGCRQRAAVPPSSSLTTDSSSEADSLARINARKAAEPYVEQHIVRNYSEQELKRIMDVCGELLSNAPDIRKNFMSASVNVFDHRIDIQLIVTNEKTVKEFREKVMDSPAFHFIKRDYGLAPTNGVQDINGLYLRTEYPVYHTSTDSIRVIFYNRNVLQTYSGSAYKIAYEEEGVWKILPKNDFTTLLAYRTDPNSDYSFFAYLLPDLHPNKPGRYRIYYEVTLGEEIRSGADYNLIAEFRLSDDKEECGQAVKAEIPALNPKVDLNKLYEVDKKGDPEKKQVSR